MRSDETLKRAGSILLVDDEPLIRLTGATILKEYGYNVMVAENGAVAVELFQKHHNTIDLVIMDMMMPEMDGREAFFKMKTTAPECKVIICSGFTTEKKIEDLTKAGLLDFLRKPFRQEELLQLLKKYISTSK